MVEIHAEMSTAQYLIRFDDICPTMNWAVWDAIETILIEHDIRPILAVIPDNCDPTLQIEPPRADFWERVRGWQEKGYAIALHGYQHSYVNDNPGLMRLTYKSEFAGLPRHEQETKLRKGLAIFDQNGIRADAWVAPSHSFDRITIDLLLELGVSVISDGLCRWPFTDSLGMTWVPQQLWRFNPKPAGIWTICCHHNHWTPDEIEIFSKNLTSYASLVTDMEAVMQRFVGRRATFNDYGHALFYWAWHHYLPPARAWARRLSNHFPSKQ